MSDAVRGDEIEERRGAGHRDSQLVDRRVRAISHEDRAGLRAQAEHVARAVVLFVFARAFVFADRVVVVFVNRTAGHKTGLFMPAYAQPVEIETRFVFDD